MMSISVRDVAVAATLPELMPAIVTYAITLLRDDAAAA